MIFRCIIRLTTYLNIHIAIFNEFKPNSCTLSPVRYRDENKEVKQKACRPFSSNDYECAIHASIYLLAPDSIHLLHAFDRTGIHSETSFSSAEDFPVSCHQHWFSCLHSSCAWSRFPVSCVLSLLSGFGRIQIWPLKQQSLERGNNCSRSTSRISLHTRSAGKFAWKNEMI